MKNTMNIAAMVIMMLKALRFSLTGLGSRVAFYFNQQKKEVKNLLFSGSL